MRTINKAFAGVCLGLLLLAAFPVCVSAFDGVVTPKGAKRGPQAADAAEQSGNVENAGNAENVGSVDGIAALHNGKNVGTPSGAVQTGDGEDDASGSATRTAAGTAVLIGAGAYTFMRTKWKEQEDMHRKEPVCFVNHTREGAEEARNFAMENAGKTVAGDSAKM